MQSSLVELDGDADNLDHVAHYTYALRALPFSTVVPVGPYISPDRF